MQRISVIAFLVSVALGPTFIARAQVHQMICNSIDAPGISLTALPALEAGDAHRALVGACGTYMILRVERGPYGLVAVGDTTFTWAGASSAHDHPSAHGGSDPDTSTRRGPS